MVFLHDVGWPYGRRDLYYAPLTIPEAYRQPYRCAGMRLNSSGLHETGGLNAHMHNAVAEGGAHNGVLTAVEDFLKTSTDSFQLAQVPGFYGLGILASQARLASNPQLAAFIPKLEGALARAERIRALESQRLAAEIVVQNLERPAWPDARLRPLARLRLRAARLRYKLVARTLSQSLSHWIEHS